MLNCVAFFILTISISVIAVVFTENSCDNVYFFVAFLCISILVTAIAREVAFTDNIGDIFN